MIGLVYSLIVNLIVVSTLSREPNKAKSATRYLDFLLKIKSKDIVPTIVKITISSVEIAR